ncbi:interaptin-like isoform X4 [Myzus persicae]|uniref:interaptin-like isoform X4 n=1 Tax=Myzus persicae TaxID=13164 RepID=UPI000B939E28|nr:interaptin-like isoform X4 [Myzus persicae]
MSSTVSEPNMQKLMDEIEKLIKRANRDHEDKIEHLQKENNELVSDKTNLTTKIEEYEDKIRKLKQENHELVTDKTNITTKIEEEEDEIQKLKQENNELVSDKTNLTTKIEEYEDKIRKLQQENNELVTDKTNITTKIEEEEDEIQKLKQPCMYSVCAEFSNLKIYNRMSVSPVKGDKGEQCTVWWCPKHSNFDTIVKDFKPNNETDQKILQLGKARNAYWKKNGEIKCCKNDRKKKNSNDFSPPSNWPK